MCLSYFSVAVIKQHDQKQLIDGKVKSFPVQRERSALWWGGMAASSRHGGRRKKLGDHIFSNKLEAESELDWDTVMNSEGLPLVKYFLSSRAQAPKCPQTEPPMGTNYPNA